MRDGDSPALTRAEVRDAAARQWGVHGEGGACSICKESHCLPSHEASVLLAESAPPDWVPRPGGSLR